MQLPKSAIEGATKWDPGNSRLSRDVYHFHSHVRLCRSQQTPCLSFASALQFEVLKARNRVKELEVENKHSRKKLKHFVNKLSEERAFWMRKEHQKMRKIVDELKGELRRERRNCQQLDMLNSKLLSDLADTKVSVRRYMQDYEKERKAREILEKVCTDLAKKVEEDSAEIEALDGECTKIRDEVDEERKMLQLSEVWREERVQMKLVDARLILEEKYSEMSDLISGLETFLKSRNVSADTIEIGEARMIKRAIDTLKNHETPKFSPVSPLSNDKYAVSEGPETSRAKELGIDYYLGNSPSHASGIHNVNPGSDSFRKLIRNSYSKSFVDNDEGCKDANSTGTVTQVDDQRSNHTCGGSEKSVNRVVQNRYVKQNSDQGSPGFETSEISCVQPKHPKKKGTTLRKLWSSSPNNDDECRTTTSPDENRRLSNGSSHNIDVTSLEKVSSVEVTNSHNNGLVNLSCSPVLGNHHIARAMKGCIEWPRGNPRQGLKAKLLEARLESQKSQLRNILKQRT
nr:WEB family protein At4g27595, chloroplastic-like [Ipomoea batatas]